MKLSDIIPPPLRGIELRSYEHIGVISELVAALIAAERFDPKYKKALFGQFIENYEGSIGCGWVVLSGQHKGVLGTAVGVYGNAWGCTGFDNRDSAPVTQVALLLGSTLNPPVYANVVEAMRFFCDNLKPNVHHVFNITDTFWIKGRGLVIAADRPLLHQIRSSEKLIFVQPNGSLARGVVVNVEMIDPRPRDSAALCVKDVDRKHLPPGTKVWWINEGTAGAGILVKVK